MLICISIAKKIIELSCGKKKEEDENCIIFANWTFFLCPTVIDIDCPTYFFFVSVTVLT